MGRQPQDRTDRQWALSGTLSSALKIGALVAGIAIALYSSGQDTVRPAIDVAATTLNEEIDLGTMAAEGEEDTPVLNGIDPGEYRLSATGPEPSEVSEAENAQPERLVVQIRRGDTLLDVLLGVGIPRAEAHEAVSAIASVYDPRNLRPGQEITLTLDSLASDTPSLIEANLNASAERDINLSRDSDGRFTALARKKELRRELIRAIGTVNSSLFEAGSAAGVPGAIMVDLIRAFSYDVDFQRDVHPGDSFEIVFERYRDAQGRFAKDGDILFGRLTLAQGGTKRIYRFVHRDGTADFYNENGESVRKALLKTPIDGARLSSRFGMRKHPILGYSAMHKGVDFAAPQGTPVQAAGDGIVEAAGWHGAYGNYVRIRHNSEYSTAYAHLSRIAAAVKPGAHVRQGQVLGYVGSTGRSTGPHLHYEVLRRGTAINPTSVRLPTGRKLDGQELVQFRIAKADIDLTVAAIEPTTRVARNADESAPQAQ